MSGISPSSTPLFYIALTLGIYVLSLLIYSKLKNPLFHPVFITIVSVIIILLVFDVPYSDYMRGGEIISFFLGPSVVALAVPLYKERERIRNNLGVLSIVVPFGSLVGIIASVVPVLFFNPLPSIAASLAPKSVTTPIAIEVSAVSGGIPNLTAVVVVFTGLFGALAGPVVLKLLGIVSEAAVGFGLGFASHGIGTARAVEEGESAGAFAGLAICLNGICTAIVMPLIMQVLYIVL